MFRFFQSEIWRSTHPLRRLKSFKYAFEGLFHALLNEANFRIQVIIVILSVIGGIYLNISIAEWCVLTLSMGFLLMAEMINTVVEEFIDHIIKEESPVAKIIKDLGAGFVFVAALTALIILTLIFGQHISFKI
jgi:diacylglycerol kinase